MSDKEIENNASNEEASETVETPESVDSTPETAETVVEAEEVSTPEESVPEAPADTPEPEADVPAEEASAAEEEPAEAISTAKLEELSPAQIVQNFEKSQLKDDVPPFRPGDTVVVSVKVREGERTRLQAFEGVVMGVKKAGLNSSFIVRKISSGIGVERTFQTHSPMIDSIKVKRKGDVRQAKLFYLRERSGKSARIKERLE